MTLPVCQPCTDVGDADTIQRLAQCAADLSMLRVLRELKPGGGSLCSLLAMCSAHRPVRLDRYFSSGSCIMLVPCRGQGTALDHWI